MRQFAQLHGSIHSGRGDARSTGIFPNEQQTDGAFAGLIFFFRFFNNLILILLYYRFLASYHLS